MCARIGVHMHFPSSHCSFVKQFRCLCVHTVILSFYFGHKSKLLRTCARFSGVEFALWDQEYGGRGLDSGVVALVKQLTMHQHSKLFEMAMKWSCYRGGHVSEVVTNRGSTVFTDTKIGILA